MSDVRKTQEPRNRKRSGAAVKTGSVRGVQHGPVPVVFRIHRLAVIGVHAVRGMAVGVRAGQQGDVYKRQLPVIVLFIFAFGIYDKFFA